MKTKFKPPTDGVIVRVIIKKFPKRERRPEFGVYFVVSTDLTRAYWYVSCLNYLTSKANKAVLPVGGQARGYLDRWREFRKHRDVVGRSYLKLSPTKQQTIDTLLGKSLEKQRKELEMAERAAQVLRANRPSWGEDASWGSNDFIDDYNEG